MNFKIEIFDTEYTEDGREQTHVDIAYFEDEESLYHETENLIHDQGLVPGVDFVAWNMATGNIVR